MAQRRNNSRGGRSSPARRPQQTKAARERELELKKRKRQSVAVVIFAFAILFFILSVFGGINQSIHSVLGGLFGGVFCSLMWCFLIFYISILLALDRPDSRIGVKITLATFLILLLCSFYYTVAFGDSLAGADAKTVIVSLYKYGAAGEGTGVIGGCLGALMVSMLGKWLSIVIILLVAFVLAMLLTRTGLIQLFKTVSVPVKKATEYSRARAEQRADMRRSTPRFELDVPLDDEPPAEEKRPSSRRKSRALSHVLIEDEPAEAPVPEPEQPEVPEKSEEPVALPDESADEPLPDIDELTNRAALKKTKKQKAAEIEQEAKSFEKEVNDADEGSAEYRFPPLDLLAKPQHSDDQNIRTELKHNAEMLVAALDEYGVAASVIDISRGPAVTRYELKPAPGVKISKITSLTNDIALRLAAKAVRIEAPIPGKPAVGIEIPNQKVTTVRVRELIDSEQFREAKSPLTVCIGRDIEGNIVLADLAKMPHLLVAGSTGSGKSVCINSMLISLIYKSSPADVRLIMVDPKAVEMDVYNGIPHLLVPVVCDPKKAAGALQWAVSEMLKRYALLKEHGVRNLDGYNKLAEQSEDMEKLPRIVIIIDEMADLMAASPKEVEDAIARLAAMARAAGMHMVLATQRPSVDVITGTIKNNIPSRIAFAVSSQIDSRTILDEGGAEGLIGMGDMLFNPLGVQKPKRVQGCFVADDEVENVVKFVKQNGTAEYDESIAQEIERNASDNSGKQSDDSGEGFGDVDVLFNKAIEVVIEAGQASTAMLQRRLGIGYARAGRLIDQLAERNIIGPFEGSKPRQVLITRQQFLEMTMSRDDVSPSSESPEESEPDFMPDDGDDDIPF